MALGFVPSADELKYYYGLLLGLHRYPATGIRPDFGYPVSGRIVSDIRPDTGYIF